MVAAVDSNVTMSELKGIYVALFAESGSQHGARTEKYKGEEGQKKLNTLIDGLRHEFRTHARMARSERWQAAVAMVEELGEAAVDEVDADLLTA